MTIEKITPTAMTATQILDSLRIAVNHNADDVGFEDYYANDIKRQVFILSWFDYDLDHMIVIRSKVSWTSISNYENCCYDYDVDSLDLYKITVGDGVYQNEIPIPEGLNEHTLRPLISAHFDFYNESLKYEQSGYSINLLSETPSKRGDNWIMIA